MSESLTPDQQLRVAALLAASRVYAPMSVGSFGARAAVSDVLAAADRMYEWLAK